MQAGAVPLQPAAQAVYGLNIQNGRLAQLTKRVLTMAMLAAILVVIQQVANFVISHDKSAQTVGAGLLGLVFALLVPCCGYWGAKNSSRELTCCFCGCNCVLSVLTVINVLLVYIGYMTFKYLVDNCEPDAPDPQSMCQPGGGNMNMNDFWVNLCTSMGKPDQTAEQCWQYVHDTMVPSMLSASILALICCVPSFILQCLSFWFGKQLYDALQEGQVIHAAPRAPVMATLPAQPVVAMPAQPINPIPVQALQQR